MWTAKTDQTGQMPRLICVFAGRILTLLVLSYRGSYVHYSMVKSYFSNFTIITAIFWMFKFFKHSSLFLQ